jgi:hypothetical protein
MISKSKGLVRRLTPIDLPVNWLSSGTMSKVADHRNDHRENGKQNCFANKLENELLAIRTHYLSYSDLFSPS